MTFKEGGAFDFSATYDRLKERMSQAVSVAQENGSNGLRTGGSGLPQADLEELPAYSEAANGPSPVPPQTPSPAVATSPQHTAAGSQAHTPAPNNETILPSTEEAAVKPEPGQQSHPPPDEPPPGYEETQAATVARDLEHNIRTMSAERKII